MESVLRKLNIYLEGSYSKDGSYVVDIYDSDDFGRVYSLLDNNNNVEELDDSSLLNQHSANISYLYVFSLGNLGTREYFYIIFVSSSLIP